MKLHEIVGNAGIPVSGGKEVLYLCACGKEKLYFNPQSGLWICHACGLRGREWDEGLLSTSLPVMSPLPPPIILHLDREEQMTLGRPSRLISFGPSSPPVEIWNRHPIVRLQLRGKTVGFVEYLEDEPMRYKTHGARGLAFFQKGLVDYSPIGNPIRHFLFEGFWDFLNARGFLGSDDQAHYTAGNSLSDLQLGELVLRIHESPGPLFICFDNDKIRPAVELAWRLAPFLRESVFLHLPPRELGKDWDEALLKDVGRTAFEQGTRV